MRGEHSFLIRNITHMQNLICYVIPSTIMSLLSGKRLSKISATSKTHNNDDFKSYKLVTLNQKEVAFD